MIIVLVNNNDEGNEYTETCGSVSEVDDTQTQILSDQSDPENQHNVYTEPNLQPQSEETTDTLAPKGTRRGARKQNNALIHSKAVSSIR